MLPVFVANRFFGILALVAVAVTVAAVVMLLTRRVPSWARDAALPLATAIAAVTTLASLYYSEIVGYPPCTLCWYQRIAIFPQVIILGVASLRRDVEVWRTAVPLAVVGGALSVWHIVIERVPELAGPCDPANPCTIKWVEEFGFLTVPTMALIAAAAFIALTLLARGTSETSDTRETRDTETETDRSIDR